MIHHNTHLPLHNERSTDKLREIVSTDTIGKLLQFTHVEGTRRGGFIAVCVCCVYICAGVRFEGSTVKKNASHAALERIRIITFDWCARHTKECDQTISEKLSTIYPLSAPSTQFELLCMPDAPNKGIYS